MYRRYRTNGSKDIRNTLSENSSGRGHSRPRRRADPGTVRFPTNVFYMTRVIDNLLQNAAKFTAAGSVTLSCEKDDSKRRLRIRVADTGIGIDPDKREWVFERFAKVDPFKPGSGIGLYLCRLIVTRLGGEIRVCPEYRAGCCIDIVLPC